jgi:chromosomal replication initiation ATPase DnaA
MQVGRMLNKDHTSVLHGYRRMEEKIANGLKLD